MVSVNGNSTTNPYAVSIWGAEYVYANFLVPNGEFYISTMTGVSQTVSGNINAKIIDTEDIGTYLDAGGGGSTSWTGFSILMSWKDQ